LLWGQTLYACLSGAPAAKKKSYITPGPNVTEHFTVVITKFEMSKSVCPFQPSLMFAGKAGSLS
jgi:hypothetical protein